MLICAALFSGILGVFLIIDETHATSPAISTLAGDDFFDYCRRRAPPLGPRSGERDSHSFFKRSPPSTSTPATGPRGGLSTGGIRPSLQAERLRSRRWIAGASCGQLVHEVAEDPDAADLTACEDSFFSAEGMPSLNAFEVRLSASARRCWRLSGSGSRRA